MVYLNKNSPFLDFPCNYFLLRKKKDDKQFNTVIESDSLKISGPPTQHHCRADLPAGLAKQLMYPYGCSRKAPTETL